MLETGGTLEINLEDVELEGGFTVLSQEIQPGPCLKLTVNDTGHGMTSYVRERIFDPYFTTKAPGEGTGLGLAVAHGIVKSHNGAMSVYSEPGQGSSFHIYLPKLEPEAGEESVPPVKTPLPVALDNECILFVDDEEALCKVGHEMLELLGYRATVRSSPIEALEAFRECPERFDLVITDMTMSKMTGIDLAREIIRIRPNLPIILCTGFSEMAIKAKATAIGILEILMKPTDVRSLAEAIRRVLHVTGTSKDDKRPAQGQSY